MTGFSLMRILLKEEGLLSSLTPDPRLNKLFDKFLFAQKISHSLGSWQEIRIAYRPIAGNSLLVLTIGRKRYKYIFSCGVFL